MGFLGFGKKESSRSLDSIEQLQIGDIVSFKDRPPLPVDVQGVDFQVTDVAGYQYSDGPVDEFTLKSAENFVLILSLEQDDGETSICLSRKIKRKQVLSLFDEDEFADLWEPDFVALSVQQVPDKLKTWVGQTYQQQQKNASAYFYDRDLREKPASDYEDSGSYALQYHECLTDDELYGISVEIFEDGETDVYLQCYLPTDVIDGLWPGELPDENETKE